MQKYYTFTTKDANGDEVQNYKIEDCSLADARDYAKRIIANSRDNEVSNTRIRVTYIDDAVELAPANPCGTIADKILVDCADANAKIFERLESEGRLKYRASEHFKRKAQGIAVSYGSEVYTDKPVPLRVGFEHNDKGIRELRKSVKARDRSAFGKVVYRASDYSVLKEDTIGEPLGQVGKFYFIGGLRYIVRDWYFEFTTGVLTFRLQLSHIL